MEIEQKHELFIEHNINPVVLEIFYEYSICLTNYVFGTFLGDKYYDHYSMKERNAKIEDHFMFCVFKADDHFEKLGYHVINDPSLSTIFFDFFDKHFYSAEKNDLPKLRQLLFNKLSFIHVQGGLSENKMETLKKMYKYFLFSFKNEIN